MRTTHTLALSAIPLLSLSSLSVGMTGCDTVKGVAEVLGIRMPSVSLDRVDLIDGPSATQALSWSCFEFVGFCPGLDEPSESELEMSFDLVFEMTNENDAFPIPLVEILLGLAVFEDDDLGAMCISFCDPDQEDCTPSTDAEGACDVDSADTVDGASDLVPNASDLASLATDGFDDDIGNGDFRVIPAGETIEAHIQFDLAGATAFKIGKQALKQAVEDALTSGDFDLKVPYEVEGNLFFDVPDRGRYVTGFGPLKGKWRL